MIVDRVSRALATQTVSLLEDLRVSLFGIPSRRVLALVTNDGVDGRIDCRVASESGQVHGVVLAAPASYWQSLVLTHWGVALACLRGRLSRSRGVRSTVTPEVHALMLPDMPPRTWHQPGDAWRILFIGTAAGARGRGIASQLYRAVMAERSLVARIAIDNAASIRLHHSLGWGLYRDGEGALAIHTCSSAANRLPSPASRPREDGPQALDFDRTASALRRGSM